MVVDIGSMSVGDVKDFYRLLKNIVIQFNNNMRNSITSVFVKDLAIPIISFSLFNAVEVLAVKLLQKIPVSWMLRGTRLTGMIQNVVKLGVTGNQAHVRIISAPLTRARGLSIH